MLCRHLPTKWNWTEHDNNCFRLFLRRAETDIFNSYMTFFGKGLNSYMRKMRGNHRITELTNSQSRPEARTRLYKTWYLKKVDTEQFHLTFFNSIWSAQFILTLRVGRPCQKYPNVQDLAVKTEYRVTYLTRQNFQEGGCNPIGGGFCREVY